MVKIVVLDSIYMDLKWDELCSLGDCRIHEQTAPHLILERCKDAEIIITNKVPIAKETMLKCPKLKYIGITATGVNNVDLDAAKEKKILVANVPAYSTISVAQHTMALLLEALNHVGFHNFLVHRGIWKEKGRFSFWEKSPHELEGRALGIIGYGTIGQRVAKLAQAFGMKILANTRSKITDPMIRAVDRETLFRESDVISLHSPLTNETRHLINRETISLMKPNAILINASRGGLVNEQDLAAALKEKRIAAAALDVLENEPPHSDCPLLNLENCIITPHMAWASLESRKRLMAITLENIKAYLNGHPVNIVN